MTNLVALAYTLFLTLPVVLPNPTPVEKHCINVTVMAEAGGHLGTGFVITRTNQDKTIDHYVWTAGHLVANARHVPRFLGIIPNGQPATFDPIIMSICRHYAMDDITNAYIRLQWNFRGEVVRFSSDEDLALVKVTSTNINVLRLLGHNNTVFHKDESDINDQEIYHLGSYLGDDHPQPVTFGFINTKGKSSEFWKVLVEGYPGSSGGGVFLRSNGECVGMILRTEGSISQLCAPVTRMRAWAKKAGIPWAVDPSVPMP